MPHFAAWSSAQRHASIDYQKVHPAPSQHDSDQPATLAPQRHIADRPTRPVHSLDDRHGVAPILCRRTLRPRHDALSHPRSAIARCPRCFSRWSRSSPRRAYPTHGGPAEQSAQRSRSIASAMTSPSSYHVEPSLPLPYRGPRRLGGAGSLQGTTENSWLGSRATGAADLVAVGSLPRPAPQPGGLFHWRYSRGMADRVR